MLLSQLLFENPKNPPPAQKTSFLTLSNAKTAKIVKDACQLNNIDIEFKITEEGKFLCIPEKNTENIKKFKKITGILKYSIDDNISSKEIRDIINFLYDNNLYSEDIFTKNSTLSGPEFDKLLNFKNVKIGDVTFSKIKFRIEDLFLNTYQQGGGVNIDEDGQSIVMTVNLKPHDPLAAFETMIHEFAHAKQFQNKNFKTSYAVLEFLKSLDKIENFTITKLYKEYTSSDKNKFKFGKANLNFKQFAEIIAILEKKHEISYNDENFNTITLNTKFTNDIHADYKELYDIDSNEMYSYFKDNIARILMIEKIKFNKEIIKDFINDKFKLYNELIKTKFEESEEFLDIKQKKFEFDFKMTNDVIINLKNILTLNEKLDNVAYDVASEQRRKFFQKINEISSAFRQGQLNNKIINDIEHLIKNVGYNTRFIRNEENYKLIFEGIRQIIHQIKELDELTTNLGVYNSINRIVKAIMPIQALASRHKDTNLFDISFKKGNEDIKKTIEDNKKLISKLLDEETSDMHNQCIEEYSEKYFNTLISKHKKFKNLTENEKSKLKFNVKMNLTKVYNKIYEQMSNEFDKINSTDDLEKIKAMYKNIKQEHMLK